MKRKTVRKLRTKTKIKNVKTKGKKVKQISDVTEQRQSLPVPHNLWQSSVSDEALLQLRVDQRLQELTDLAKTCTNSKIKSQRGGNFEVLVKQRVKWPHEYVLSGLNKERVTYDQLNVTQWVAGFGRTMRDESDPIMKQHMLEYLIALMDDANDFSWTWAKASHAVLLCRMEQGEIKDFSDIASIDRIRRANAQKHVSAGVSATHASINKKQSKVTRSMPCTYFNQGTCMQQKTHETRGVLYKHICAVCFANTGRTFSHLSVNKNGTGSKLGSMLVSVHTEQDSAHTFNAPYVKNVNQIADSHEQLCFRGNKNKIGPTLGIMAPLNKNSSLLGSHIALDQLQAVDPIGDQDQHTVVSTGPQKIPQDILKNRFQSLDYKNCLYQNDNAFGFVPLNDLMVYMGKEVIWGSIPDIVEAHRKIRNSGLPNFMGLRIPVQSQLKISYWRKYLKQYWDHQLLDLIEYGFPLDFNRTVQLTSTEANHYSALQYPDHVSKYLHEEIQHKAIIGPFQQMPFPCHISPFLTRDKPNSTNRRVILDLSFPLGHSVNEGVPKNKYLGSYFQLSYPSIDDMVSKLKQLGPEALIYKIDISRAFRHIRIDPGDLDLLGLKHDNYYVDVMLPFGFRHGSVFFQRCTDAVRYVMKEHFHCPNLYNYIDDLIYIALPGHIDEAYSALTSLLTELGLDISISKLVPPTTVAICLGIKIDTVNQTLRIPDEKLQEIRQMVHNYSKKTQVTKKQLQSLLGSLLYITKCVRPARYFLNCMLHLLRASHNTAHIVLNQQFHRDLNWFSIFWKQYNGVTFYDNYDIQDTVHLDASLQGLGGVYQNMVYALTIPLGFMQYSIVHLEILNLIVALKLWGHLWRDKVIQIKCDNMAVVEVIRTGRARDQILATCARNI